MDEYIKREEAYEDFEKCNSENPKWTPSRVKTLVARQKSADVAPVRHAMWEVVVGSDGKEHMVCTGCRKQQDLTGVFSYCPNCGCLMDGGEQDA